MRRTRMLLTMAIVLVVAEIASAQAPPGLSGRWTIFERKDLESPAELSVYGEPWADTITLVQEADALIVQQETHGIPTTFTYRLDGAESRNLWPSREGRTPIAVVSRALRTGAGISITTYYAFNRGGTAMIATLERMITLETPDILKLEMLVSGVGEQEDAAVRRARYRRG